MEKKTYSVLLSRALDALGFSYNCIKQRQKSWEVCGESLSADEEENITDMIAGSKAEGVSRVLEGDYDLMVSLNDFVCYGSTVDMESNKLATTSIKNKDEIQNESTYIIYSRTGSKLDEQTRHGSEDHVLKGLYQRSNNQVKSVADKDEKSVHDHLFDFEDELDVGDCHEQLHQVLTENSRKTNGRQNSEGTHVTVDYDGVFLMNTENVSSGYTILKVLHLDEKKLLNSFTLEGKAVVYAKTDINGESILSSERFAAKAYECDEDEDTETVAGPAGRSLANDHYGSACDTDSVYSIPCVCKRINHSWFNRERKFDWPKQDLINEVSRMDGHVVPVGFKGSKTSSNEWRICYTLSEIKLVQSFNETQIKLHTLVKMVGKSLLQTKCPDITSYILKNVLLWMAEKIPPEKFEIENLFGLLRVALKFLTSTIQKRCLPNYMIPERNLFFGKLPEDERIEVLKVLNELINGRHFFIERYEELEFLSKHINLAQNEPGLVEYMESNRLQLESVFRKYWREVWEDRIYNFVPVCMKECASLKSLVTLCILLGVSSKTKEQVVEKIFFWITGKKDENTEVISDDCERVNPYWCWNDNGDIESAYKKYLLSAEQLNEFFDEK